MDFVAKTSRAILMLSVAGSIGCYSDQPYGSPEFGRIGWMPTGDAFVTIQQPYHRAYSDGLYVKYRYLIVAADGHTQSVDSVPTLLAPSCSDNPPALDPCIVATSMSSTFQLSDGSTLVFSPTADSITRTASDGTVLWTDRTDLNSIDAVRANRVLAGDQTTVSRIDVETGTLEWTVSLPSGL
jgi:hypothetical protein